MFLNTASLMGACAGTQPTIAHQGRAAFGCRHLSSSAALGRPTDGPRDTPGAASGSRCLAPSMRTMGRMVIEVRWAGQLVAKYRWRSVAVVVVAVLHCCTALGRSPRPEVLRDRISKDIETPHSSQVDWSTDGAMPSAG